MEKQKKSKEPKLNPVTESFVDQFPSDKFGTGVITGKWKAIFLLIPFLLYFLSLFDSTIIV
jgi:hypothetical protein